MKRCLLTLRFGKDVAGLVYRYVWQSCINNVHQTYCDLLKWDEKYQCVRMTSEYKEFWFNNRCYDHGSYIFNVRLTQNVATLPLNYWRTKELY